MDDKKSKADQDLWGDFDTDDWTSSKETSVTERKSDELDFDTSWAKFDEISPLRNKTADVLQAEADMRYEQENENWISGPGNQAILMASKTENRLEKGKNFHGFTLEQHSLEDSEFIRFIQALKDAAPNIPPETRIELAIVTRFIDPDYEWSADYEEGRRKCVHWTAVDLMVDEQGNINSFVLDAANSYGYARMHDTLKEMFPSGRHYVYKKEVLSDGSNQRVSPIQTQERGCRVFTVEHLKQLSTIDTETLYSRELPQIADENGVIKASSFSGDLKLSRIFRGMQTWTGLRSLPESMQNTVIKEKTGETLIKYAERQSTYVRGVMANQTIAKKARRYIEKKHSFYQTLSPENQERIIENRQGFLYLRHPQLFKLSDRLAAIDTRNNIEGLMQFSQKICADLEKIEKKLESDASDVHACLNELSQLSPFKTAGAIKHEILLSISDLYQKLDLKDDFVAQEELSKTIDNWVTPKNPATVFRSILADEFNSEDSTPRSSENSTPKSPY